MASLLFWYNVGLLLELGDKGEKVCHPHIMTHPLPESKENIFRNITAGNSVGASVCMQVRWSAATFHVVRYSYGLRWGNLVKVIFVY